MGMVEDLQKGGEWIIPIVLHGLEKSKRRVKPRNRDDAAAAGTLRQRLRWGCETGSWDWKCDGMMIHVICLKFKADIEVLRASRRGRRAGVYIAMLVTSTSAIIMASSSSNPSLSQTILSDIWCDDITRTNLIQPP